MHPKTKLLLRAVFRLTLGAREQLSAQVFQPSTLVLPNHVSLLDGLLVAAFAPGPCVFAVDSDFACRAPWKWGLRALERAGLGRVVPLDMGKPLGLRSLIKALQAGETVCVFGQGRIQDETDPVVFQMGVRRLEPYAREVIGVFIDGAGRTVFGRTKGRSAARTVSLSTASVPNVAAAEMWLESIRRRQVFKAGSS